jgi:hypothetical protein
VPFLLKDNIDFAGVRTTPWINVLQGSCALRVTVEPRAYLGEAARRAIRNSGAVTLPRDLK